MANEVKTNKISASTGSSISVGSNTLTNGVDPINPQDIATKAYVDSSSSGGDVVGPGSATDNSIARFDSTTGKLLQNSGVSIDDSNNVVVPGSLTSSTSLVLEDPGAGSNKITIQSPTLSGDVTLTLPVDDGAPDQVLSTNGSGVLSWVDQSGGGGGATPAGNDTNIQFNAMGAFGANDNLSYDYTNNELGIGTLTPTSTLTITSQGGTGTFLTDANPALLNLLTAAQDHGNPIPYQLVLSGVDNGPMADVAIYTDTSSTYNGTGQLKVTMNDGNGGQITPFTIHIRDDNQVPEISSFAQLNMKGNDIVDAFSLQFHNNQNVPTTYYVESIDHVSVYSSDSIQIKSGSVVDGDSGSVSLFSNNSTNGSSGNVFLQTGTAGTTRGQALIDSGTLVVTNTHIRSTQTTAPTTTTNANAGGGASSSVSNATDSAGNLSLTLGTITLSSGEQVKVNFNKSYTTAPIVQLMPTNAAAVNNDVLFGIFITSTTADFSVNFATAGTALAALTWNYIVIETQS